MASQVWGGGGAAKGVNRVRVERPCLPERKRAANAISKGYIKSLLIFSSKVLSLQRYLLTTPPKIISTACRFACSNCGIR